MRDLKQRFFAAAEDAERYLLLFEMPPAELAAVDQESRTWSIRSEPIRKFHATIRAEAVFNLAPSPYFVSRLGLVSFHPNGHVREAAIQRLAEIHTGEELPFLLIRLNDWVMEVREKAHDAVILRMDPSYAEHFLRHIALVLRLEMCGRANRRIVGEITAFLKGPECRSALESAAASGDRLVRRTGKWRSLHAVLKLCCDADERLALKAKAALNRWFKAYNRSYLAPTGEEIEKIHSALAEVESELPYEQTRELRACIQSFVNDARLDS